MGALRCVMLLSQLCTMSCGCSGAPQTPPLAAGTCSTSGEVLRVGLKGQHLMNTDKRGFKLFMQLCKAIPAILSISQVCFFFLLHSAAVQPHPLCTSRQQRRWWGQKNAQDSSWGVSGGLRSPSVAIVPIEEHKGCRAWVLESQRLSAAGAQLL